MKTLRLCLIVGALALAFDAQAQTGTTTPATTATTTAAGTETKTASSNYLARAEGRFGAFAGSSANLESLATGLRSGKSISLDGSGERVTFTSPTKPMGYGNITRALDLAQRDLAASGISDPTPKEIQASLMGGTVAGPNGPVTCDGILQMRADGMGWGQIAHAIGVHPGLGAPAAAKTVPAFPAAASRHAGGIVSAGGGSPFSHGNGNGHALGRATRASPPTASAAGAAGANAGGIAKGGGNGNAFGRAK